MKKVFLVAQVIFSLAILADYASANTKVIVHVHNQELHRDKSLLTQESTYFRDKFAKTFGASAAAHDGEVHEYLDRNFDSLKAVWDFLIYSEVYSKDPVFLEQVLADAEFLGIEKLKEYLASRLEQIKPTKKWKRDFQVIRDISSSGEKKLSQLISTYADKEKYRLISVAQILNMVIVVFDAAI